MLRVYKGLVYYINRINITNGVLKGGTVPMGPERGQEYVRCFDLY